MEEALAPFRAQAETKQIELRMTVTEGLEVIRCDRASLGMALANLLDNALKYTASGGVVEVTASEVGQTTVLSVTDSGPGILPADQERIFERFYRGGGSELLPGAGLGLAIVKSAVEAHGGGVRVESEAGAAFTIVLPTTSSQAREEISSRGLLG